MSIGMRPLERDKSCYVIVTEYNRGVQGFMVGSVDRIINIGWDSVKAPLGGAGKESYLTAVTEFENELIEVIDVEKVMKEVIGSKQEASEELLEAGLTQEEDRVLIVDDSLVARNQVKKVCSQVGLEAFLCKDGLEAWEHLKELAQQGIDIARHYTMIISDVEMPRMDGYTLATRIKEDPLMKDVYLILHTSLSGVFNSSMVEKVGANEFQAKFEPDELVKTIQNQLKRYHAEAED